MKRWILLLLLAALMAGCASQPASAPTLANTSTASPVPATPTVTPSPVPPTETITPAPTPLPGKLVYPVESLGNTIPWLPVDENARPTVHSIFFNIGLAPFDNALVRQAFVSAVDRQVIFEMAKKYRAKNISPATSFTHPQALGRDLYNEVGLMYDPQTAKDLFAQAGYSDPSAFPVVTLIVNSYGDIAPGARYNMGKEMARMWKDNLGVTVNVEALPPQKFRERLQTNLPELFWNGWVSEQNDPDELFQYVFSSGAEGNYSKYSNPELNQLVRKARGSNNPAERQMLYIMAERIICEIEAVVMPLYHMTFP